MRISDWSSDVCSSDLRSQLVPGSGTATINRYSVGVGVTSFELDFWGRVKNLSEAARSQYLATEAAERAFRLEIGRASCGERVCQFVSIQVVAGSLKQKLYIMHTY